LRCQPVTTIFHGPGSACPAVADPFLHIAQNGSLYIFFETKTIASNQGDIAVASSTNYGASWQYLGIALDEPHHLSYPFIFSWNEKVCSDSCDCH
jgi:hypothetical protein